MQSYSPPPADCSSRILKAIREQAGITPTTAVNKLVSKVATRTIRPTGLIQVQAGTEAEFLQHRDIRIFPGMGPKLRRMARGIDDLRVEEGGVERRIVQQADFDTDIIEETAIRGAIEALVENGGLVMRRDKLGASVVKLIVVYADGVRAEGREKAIRLYGLRVRSIGLALEGLTSLGYEPDLFEAETETKDKNLQEAADKIRTRFGADKLMKGVAFGASKLQGEKRLLPTGAGVYGH